MPRAPAQPEELGSDTVTRGIRVRVRPAYLPDHSDPQARRWVFGYQIAITNENPPNAAPARLLTRRWLIVDADGERQIVEGEGVIGRQPLLAPGETHEYSSFCPLSTPWGTMEGSYRFRSEPDGLPSTEFFDVKIGRFYLAPPPAASGPIERAPGRAPSKETSP